MSVTNGGLWIDRLMKRDNLSFVSNPCIWVVSLMYFKILGLVYFGNYRLRDVYMMGERTEAYVGILDMLRVVYMIYKP